MRRDAVDAERAVPIPVDQQRGVARLPLDREQQEAREAVDREPRPSQRRLVNERERCRADDDQLSPTDTDHATLHACREGLQLAARVLRWLGRGDPLKKVGRAVLAPGAPSHDDDLLWAVLGEMVRTILREGHRV